MTVVGRPKERRLKTKLAEIAKPEIGLDATAVDWVVQKVAGGVTIGKIAEYLAHEMNESISRSFFSWYINHASPDAKERIKAARKEAAHIILDEALEIADRQVEGESSASVQRARLQADTRVRLAALWNKEAYGTQQAQVQVGIGALYLDALRQCAAIPARTPPMIESGETDYEIGSDSGLTGSTRLDRLDLSSARR